MCDGFSKGMMFFSFDGIDGVGKTTQMELFCDWLRESGHDVVTCRDPGSTQLGEALRSIVLTRDETPIDPLSEMLIYMSARAQLVQQIIRPALDSGRTIVSDRFLLANIVYQGYAGGLDIERVRQVGQVATSGVAPILTILLDMDVRQAGQRIDRSLDRMEARGVEYMERVRQGFLTEAKLRPDEIVVVDASRDVKSVQAEIRAAADRVIQNSSS